MSLYSNSDMINRFRNDIMFSSTGREEDMVLESCSGKERHNMDTSDEPSAPYFYLYLPVIHELWVSIPFTSFEEDFLLTINVVASQITLNVWSMLRYFQIVYCRLGVSLIVGLFL